jgi:hypothetical protein
MDKSMKLDVQSHSDLNELMDTWKSKNMKDTMGKMIEYFKENHINPFDKKPLGMPEQMARLKQEVTKVKDTVIGWHTKAEAKQKQDILKILAHDREILLSNQAALEKTIAKDDLKKMDDRVRKVVEQNDANQAHLANQIDKALERAASADKYRKQTATIIETAFSELLKTRTLGVISKEDIEKTKNAALNSLIRL